MTTDVPCCARCSAAVAAAHPDRILARHLPRRRAAAFDLPAAARPPARWRWRERHI